jgi:hypothetical protein
MVFNLLIVFAETEPNLRDSKLSLDPPAFLLDRCRTLLFPTVHEPQRLAMKSTALSCLAMLLCHSATLINMRFGSTPTDLSSTTRRLSARGARFAQVQ